MIQENANVAFVSYKRVLLSRYARCTRNAATPRRAALRWRARVQRKSLDITDAAAQREEADAERTFENGNSSHMRHCFFENLRTGIGVRA